jgi:hypothetical protein
MLCCCFVKSNKNETILSTLHSWLGMPQGTPRIPFPKVPAIFSLPDSPRNRI